MTNGERLIENNILFSNVVCRYICQNNDGSYLWTISVGDSKRADIIKHNSVFNELESAMMFACWLDSEKYIGD